MKPEIVELICAALESGNYQQTKSALGRTEANEDDEPAGHCCLGVICEEAIKAGVPVTKEEEEGRIFYDGGGAYLPTIVKEWAGMCTINGALLDPKGDSLVHLNDSGKSFKEIAKFIREHANEL